MGGQPPGHQDEADGDQADQDSNNQAESQDQLIFALPEFLQPPAHF